MLGHRVEVQCILPDETFRGVLQAQTAGGVTVYAGTTRDTAHNIFIPMHRIVRMDDCGEVYR